MSEEKTTTVNQGAPAVQREDIEALKKRTLTLSIIEGSAWSVMWGIGEAMAAPFAIFLNAGNIAMALFGTLPIILGALAQIYGAGITERIGRRKPVLITGGLVQAFSYLLLFCIPYMFPRLAVPMVVIIFTMTLVAANVTVPAWSSIMGDVIPEATRGAYMAKRTRLTFLAMIVSLFAAGKLLTWFKGHDQMWLGFGLFFGIAAAARFFSAYLFTKHYDAPFHASQEDYFSFWEFIKGTPRSNFAKFTFAIALIVGATNISVPFFNVYMLRDLKWSPDQFATSTNVFLIAQVIVVPWWGTICDRHGNRATLVATSAIIPFLPIVWAITTNYHAILCLQAVSGMAWSGFNLAIINFIFDSVSQQKRPRAISYFGVVNGVFVLIGGSVIGAFLAENLPSSYSFCGFHVNFLSSLPSVFIISGILRAIAALVLLPTFSEVRKSEPISTGEILWRLTSGEPVLGQIGQLFSWVSAPMRRSNGNGEKKRDVQE